MHFGFLPFLSVLFFWYLDEEGGGGESTFMVRHVLYHLLIKITW